MWVGDSVDMVSPRAPRESCDLHVLTPLLDFLIILMEQLQSFSVAP